MAEHSSTSSFENNRVPPGVPKAFLLSLVFIAIVELCIRFAGPSRMNPYEVGDHEYDAVAAWLAEVGPAEVSILGTSREREALALPILRTSLEKELGRPISVGNYGLAGARAPEIEAAANDLLQRGKPALVMYGIQPRTLLGQSENPTRMAMFWSFDDYQRRRALEPDRYADVLPTVFRHEMGEFYRTLRYRARISAMVREVYEILTRPKAARKVKDAATFEPIPSGVVGDLTFFQQYQPNTSLETRHISDEHVENYVRSVMENGRYELTPRKIDQFRRTIQTIQQAGVSVVIFEVPLCQLLKRHLPPGTMDTFYRVVQEVAKETNVRFVTAAELDFEPSDAEMLEQSHLNLKGATRLTERLTERVIVPTLRSIAPR